MDNPPADVGLETVTALHSFPSAVDCLQMFKIECSAGMEPLALDSNAIPSCEERSSAAVLVLFFHLNLRWGWLCIVCAIDDKIVHTVPWVKVEVSRTQNGTVTHHKKNSVFRCCLSFHCSQNHPIEMPPGICSAAQVMGEWETDVLPVRAVPLYLCSGNCFVSSALLLSVLRVDSGSTLHAGRRDPPGHPPGTNPSHANAAQHHPDGPPTAAWLPAHRRAHHRLLLLADGHHRHHQSRAGQWSILWSAGWTGTVVSQQLNLSFRSTSSQFAFMNALQSTPMRRWDSLNWHLFRVNRVSVGVKYADNTDKWCAIAMFDRNGPRGRTRLN